MLSADDMLENPAPCFREWHRAAGSCSRGPFVLTCRTRVGDVAPSSYFYRYEVIMAVKSGEVAVNLGNSRVQFPPSLSNRWELIGTLPAFILSNRTKNPTQIGSLSNHRKSRSVTFSTIFDRSQHPPPYAVF